MRPGHSWCCWLPSEFCCPTTGPGRLRPSSCTRTCGTGRERLRHRQLVPERRQDQRAGREGLDVDQVGQRGGGGGEGTVRARAAPADRARARRSPAPPPARRRRLRRHSSAAPPDGKRRQRPQRLQAWQSPSRSRCGAGRRDTARPRSPATDGSTSGTDVPASKDSPTPGRSSRPALHSARRPGTPRPRRCARYPVPAIVTSGRTRFVHGWSRLCDRRSAYRLAARTWPAVPAPAECPAVGQPAGHPRCRRRRELPASQDPMLPAAPWGNPSGCRSRMPRRQDIRPGPAP